MKPTLLYDRDCTFCLRMVKRWSAQIGDAVQYRAFQEAAADFPQIPKEAYRESVQFVVSGEVFSGARAVVELLAHAPKKRWYRWGYLHIPFAKRFSEFLYKKVSSCRTCAEKMAQTVWGDA